jgi:excisionase family DNA binding protein
MVHDEGLDEIMTVNELAEYLKVTPSTIYRLAKAGEIPAVRVGRSWRFKRELIDAWIRSGGERGSDEA